MPFEITHGKWTVREFFALWPRLTIHGWAWLTDVRAVSACRWDQGKLVETRHYLEKIHAG